jgi:hypothetical protein
VEDTPVSIDLLGSASDVDASDARTFSIATGPAHGTLQDLGSAMYKYTPDANYHGADSFVFRVTDRAGAFATATVTLTIIPGSNCALLTYV